jgi:hypothetical protein
MFSKRSRPEAVIRGEEKLVELDELDDEFIKHFFKWKKWWNEGNDEKYFVFCTLSFVFEN